MPLEKPSGWGLDSSLKRSELSNEQMFKFIKVSMAHLEEEVSVMAETLEALQQELIRDSQERMI